MEVLAQGRAPRSRHGGRARSALAVGAAAALVLLAAGSAAWRGASPGGDASAVPGGTRVSAQVSGTSAVHGRLRVYLLLRGAASAPLDVPGAGLSGLRTRVLAPSAFDAQGTAAVRLDVQPACPAAGRLQDPALRVRVDGREQRVPFTPDAVLADVVAARCEGRLGAQESDVRPALVPGTGGGPGVRAVLLLAGDGPLRVDEVRAGPGLALAARAGPFDVPARRVRPVVLDLLPGRCAAEPGTSPVVLVSGGSRAEPRVDAGLQAQLDALRAAACRGAR